MATDTRTTDNRYSGYVYGKYQYGTNPETSKTYGTSSQQLGVRRSIVSERAGRFEPGPRTFRANPCVIERITGTCKQSSSQVVSPDGLSKESIEGYITCAGSDWTNGRDATLLSGPSWLKDRAVQRAYAKLNANDLDLGVELGELKETLAMLRNPFKDLRKLLNKDNSELRKILSSGWNAPKRDALQAFTSTWMEYRYGLRPLIRSINEIIEEFYAVKKRLTGLRQRARGKVLYESTTLSTKSTLATTLHVFDRKAVHRYKLKAVSNLYYVLDVLPDLLERYGLVLTDLPLIAWNLTSRSFVVDWFLTVGPWLQSLKINDKKTLLGECTSIKIVETTEVEVYSGRDYWSRPIPTSHGKYIRTTERLVRTVGNARPLTPVFRRELLDLPKTIDLLIMLWQSMPKQNFHKR